MEIWYCRNIKRKHNFKIVTTCIYML